MTKNYKTSGGKLDTINHNNKTYISIGDLIYMLSENIDRDSLISGLKKMIDN